MYTLSYEKLSYIQDFNQCVLDAHQAPAPLNCKKMFSGEFCVVLLSRLPSCVGRRLACIVYFQVLFSASLGKETLRTARFSSVEQIFCGAHNSFSNFQMFPQVHEGRILPLVVP